MRIGKEPNMQDKLAATLLELWAARGDPIPWQQARMMTAEQICSLVQFDHARKKCHEDNNHPTNLTPMLYAAHREKTAKQDIPQIRKGRRLEKSHEEFRAKVLAKNMTIAELKDTAATNTALGRQRSPWPKGRKIQNGGKLHSQNSFQRKGQHNDRR
jgi:hypothetical protein